MSVYTTYCGLASCTVLQVPRSPGFERGVSGWGEEEGVDKGAGVVGIQLESSEVPEEVHGRICSDSSP